MLISDKSSVGSRNQNVSLRCIEAFSGLAVFVVYLLIGVSYADDVYFDWVGGGVPRLAYVSQGQDSGDTLNSVIPTTKGNEITVTFDAGRSGSDAVANTFKNHIYSGDGVNGGAISRYMFQDGMDYRPAKLNFMSWGVIFINNDEYNIAFGQGHSGSQSTNNWWLGGVDLTGFVTAPYCNTVNDGCTTNGVLITSDGKYMFSLGGDDHHFNIQPLPSPAPNWMKFVDDEQYISSLSMPGTHDSGTYAWGYNILIEDYVTQARSILSQLNAGVRLLDIRLCDYENGGSSTVPFGVQTLYICHGAGAGGLTNDHSQITIDDVFKQIGDFLNMNPTETVAVLLKDECSPLIPELLPYLSVCPPNIDSTTLSTRLQTAINNSSLGVSGFWTQNTLPKLGEVRGKVVVINRNQDFGSGGILINGWDGSAIINSAAPVQFSIQDYYNVTDANQKSTLAFNFLANMNNSPQTDPPTWYINYLSAANGGKVKPIAQGINNEFASLIGESSASLVRFGTTMMDFIGDDPNTISITNAILSKDSGSLGVTSNVSFSASHSANANVAMDTHNSMVGGARQLARANVMRDTYSARIRLNFNPKKSIKIANHITAATRIKLSLGNHSFDRVLGDDPKSRFSSLKGGYASFIDQNGVKTRLKWNKRSLTISLKTSRPRTDGVNLVSLEPTNGVIHGNMDLTSNIGWHLTKHLLKYAGKSSTGDALTRWRIHASLK